MMTPLVSLVMTVYNREAYLADAIESVLTQTEPNFELLIWDDGSTDDSVEIAYHYASQDSRIRVVTADHAGRGVALAQAVAQTHAPFLGTVDSDDLLAQTAIAECLAVLHQNPEIGLVYTDYQVIDELGHLKGYGERCQIPYSKERLLVEFMVFHFRLMRRSVYDQVGGFDPFFQYSQDFELCLRVSEVTEIYHLQRPLYYYRHHRNSIAGQQRMEQIHYCQKAIEKALVRRGMEQEYAVEIQIFARTTLIKRSAIPSASGSMIQLMDQM